MLVNFIESRKYWTVVSMRKVGHACVRACVILVCMLILFFFLRCSRYNCQFPTTARNKCFLRFFSLFIPFCADYYYYYFFLLNISVIMANGLHCWCVYTVHVRANFNGARGIRFFELWWRAGNSRLTSIEPKQNIYLMNRKRTQFASPALSLLPPPLPLLPKA